MKKNDIISESIDEKIFQIIEDIVPKELECETADCVCAFVVDCDDAEYETNAMW